MKKSAAFTLAEIAVTLFVIAVIAIISFGITVHKLDNSIKYSYYAAYDVLRTVTANLVADTEPIEVNSTETPSSTETTTPIGPTETETATPETTPTPDTPSVSVPDTSIPETTTPSGPTEATPSVPDETTSAEENQAKVPCTFDAYYIKGQESSGCVSMQETYKYKADVKEDGTCPNSKMVVGCNWVGSWYGDKFVASGQVCSCFYLSLSDALSYSNFKSRYMPIYAFVLASSAPTATSTATTTPTTTTTTTTTTTGTGETSNIVILPSSWSGTDNFCEQFSAKANTSKVSCSTVTTEGNFAENKAAIVLNNGTRIFVTSSVPVEFTNFMSSNEYDKKGFMIYVDVDGSRNKGELYKDVFPFYVTLSGKVIPAYNSSGTAGGNDAKVLSAAVRYDSYSADGKRSVNYLKFDGKKETSFQRAACASGYLEGTYCGSYAKDAACTFEADCTMIYNKPFKF